MPSPGEDDPCRDLGRALGDIIRPVIKQAVAEAMADVLPQILAQATSDPVSVMDVPEVADKLGLSESKVKKLVAAGEIASICVGRRRKITGEAVTDYIRRLEGQQPAGATGKTR
jgi:excisionase family DNA binding protein